MWVEVEQCAKGSYRGLLANQPASTDEVLLGMEVWFEPRHVIDIMPSEEREAPQMDRTDSRRTGV